MWQEPQPTLYVTMYSPLQMAADIPETYRFVDSLLDEYLSGEKPVFIGVYIAGLGSSTNGFTVALSALFGTSLAPITGVYGIIWGVIAGWLHLAVVQSIGTVHGGLNLYNNGFSAGIVASILLPIMDMIKDHKDKERIKYLKRKKQLYDAITEQRKKMEEIENDL